MYFPDSNNTIKYLKCNSLLLILVFDIIISMTASLLSFKLNECE